jgi:cystathionine gamma-lyase
MSYRFETLSVHAGQPAEPVTGAVTVPVFQTSTFAQPSPGDHRGFCYSRTGNPTRAALEGCLAALEGASHAIAFASGLAAVNACLLLLKAGDHVIAARDLYGGTWRLFTKIFSRFGIEFSFVDTTSLSAIESAIRPETALLWLETPSNPLLKITDVAGACAIARAHNLLTVVDNTFATPYLQAPLALGADISLHSTTKYLNGHADVIGGALVTDRDDLAERLHFAQNAAGGIPGPQDCFLVLRGIKTFGLRMERHCDNAEVIARWLLKQDAVERVYYPGLPDHPGHEIATRQLRRFGAMVSFDLAGGLEAARAFARSVKLFTLAESLGAAQSLCNHPASMTHASVEPDVRYAIGLGDSLIRLSIGLEHVDDLIEDLAQALAAVPAAVAIHA